jgi:hypothetical protein
MLTDARGPQPPAKATSAFKNPLLYSSMLVGIILLFTVWTLFSRWQENRAIERRARDEKSREQSETDRVVLGRLGGKELAIQTFYASPGAIHKGESTQLCYGVANAKTVTLEPQPNAVWPSYARCVSVLPAKNTTYTLTISDASGNSKTQSLQVTVE